MSRYAGVEESRWAQANILPPLRVMAEAFTAVCGYPVRRRHFLGCAARAIGSA